ncbi:MAG: hypothetical protein Q9221_009093 [Calogaya cf. arnoldii]
MGNCLARPPRSSQADDTPLPIFHYSTPPSSAYGPYASPSRRSSYPDGYYSGTRSRSRSRSRSSSYSDTPGHRYSHSYKEKVKVYNLHPYPLEGRTLGPLHRAAEQENITLKHVPGGCYRRGRCERLHQLATMRELKSRGVDRRGMNIGQCSRVARGLPAHGVQTGGEQQGGAVPDVQAQQMLEMGAHGELRGRQPRRVGGDREMRTGYASGVEVHRANRGVTRDGSRASRSGMGSQRGGRGMDHEYAGRGGGRANSQYDDDADYNDHNDDAATYVEGDRYSVD